MSSTPDWIAEPNFEAAFFGSNIASDGDVNGDGYDDVIINAPGYEEGTILGRIYGYYGSSVGLPATPDWIVSGLTHYFCAVQSVTNAGDVNGDGYDDVAVSDPYGTGEEDEGDRVFLFFGSASGLSTTPDWAVEPYSSDFTYGTLSSAGDVNGDGYDDLIVGTPFYGDGEENEGAAFVYYGSASGLSSSADWIDESDQTNAAFGTSVSSAGDINGDGFDDVIIGACNYSNGETAEGRVFVYQGSPSGLSTVPNWTAESDLENARFGVSVSSAGDVNNDGYDDVVVGLSGYDGVEVFKGAASVFLGSSSGLSSDPSWIYESDQPDGGFGKSVAGAGDVNGDGFDDIIIGAVAYDHSDDEGAAFIFLGSSGGLSTEPDWSAFGRQSISWFGTSIDGAGDVNNDGYDDIVIGAPLEDHGEQGEGRVYAYYGSESISSTTTTVTTTSTTTTTTVGDDTEDDDSDDTTMDDTGSDDTGDNVDDTSDVSTGDDDSEDSGGCCG